MYRDRIVGLKQLPINRLVGFAGGNPKKRTDADREHLDNSLSNHGYVSPVIVRKLDDGMYEIIDGHGRVEQISEHDGDETVIKVLVLDVESVAEGRRILLALQHHTEFDGKKLEAFIADALAEGTTAEQMLVDIGPGADEIEALAAAAGDAMRELAGGAGEDDEDENERPSRAGLNPEHVQFSVEVTRDQSKQIRAAIKLAKNVHGVKTHGDALVEIANEYVRANKRGNSSAAKKTKKKR